MSKPIRLSHSSVNKHLFCQEAWRLHYVDMLRPVEVSSALVFGSAIGKTFEFILKMFTESPILDQKKIQEKWEHEWTFQTINDKLVNLKEYPTIAYSKYDTDMEFLTPDEIYLSTDKPNLAAWYSLNYKGKYMIQAFQEQFLPLVEKVYSTEESTVLNNEDGDSSIGFADAVIQLKGYPTPVIIDFKTASREYALESVAQSVQLSQYLHALGDKYNTRLAGYCVFLKSLNKNKVKTCKSCGHVGTGSHKTCDNLVKSKRCNGEWDVTLNVKCEMQLIVDTIPIETETFIIENIANVCASIKSGVFTRNVNSCFDNGFGRCCEYSRKCWKGTGYGLVRVEKKEDIIIEEKK